MVWQPEIGKGYGVRPLTGLLTGLLKGEASHGSRRKGGGRWYGANDYPTPTLPSISTWSSLSSTAPSSRASLSCRVPLRKKDGSGPPLPHSPRLNEAQAYGLEVEMPMDKGIVVPHPIPTHPYPTLPYPTLPYTLP